MDSRGAEKGVSQTRFTRTLRRPTLYVKCRIYEGIGSYLPADLRGVSSKILFRASLFLVDKCEQITRLATECLT